MELNNQTNKDSQHLILISLLSLILASFSITIKLTDPLYRTLKIYSQFPLFEFLVNLFFFFLLGLLWFVYQKWEESDRNKRELEGILSSINPDVLLVIDAEERIQQCSSSIQRVLGYSPEKVLGQKTDLLYQESQSNPGKENGPSHSLSQEGFQIRLGYGKKENGERVSLEIITASLKHRPGTVILLRDITDRTWAEEQILYLSFHDKLTGLYNRAYFEEELKRLETERQLPLSVIMGDVNGLKLVNDAFGHHVGDRLLIKIAHMLKQAFRKEDIISRLGGDEFVILLPKTSESMALELINRIRAACDRNDPGPIQLSLALGMATKNQVHQDLKEILKEAENRMYKSKLLESKSVRASIIASLRRSLFEKSHETEEHTFRLQQMATLIGRSLGMSDNELNDLALLATLHDIGKIAIPESIIAKPEKLLPEEWEIMKKHSEIGCRIAESSPDLAGISEAILTHHERWDGSGYPKGLSGETIPLISRIIAMVDAYDVMIQGRPYQGPLSPEETLLEITKGAGSQFDPNLVKMFTSLLSNDQKNGSSPI
jgi:diguanylate cyclase (GGDEF)-like protein/PAS domain S-box-containing protein